MFFSFESIVPFGNNGISLKTTHANRAVNLSHIPNAYIRFGIIFRKSTDFIIHPIDTSQQTIEKPRHGDSIEILHMQTKIFGLWMFKFPCFIIRMHHFVECILPHKFRQITINISSFLIHDCSVIHRTKLIGMKCQGLIIISASNKLIEKILQCIGCKIAGVQKGVSHFRNHRINLVSIGIFQMHVTFFIIGIASFIHPRIIAFITP